MPYGRLEQFTELIVSPKSRDGAGNLSSSPVRTSEKPRFPRKQNMDHSSSSGQSLKRLSPVPQSHQWGGIADLKSLLRQMMKGTYNQVKELPPVPDIPALLTDAIYRVCGAPPGSLCTISQAATGVIHLFPLSHRSEVVLSGSQSSVTYGILSKVPSPKETRERAKQALEKKKNAGVTKAATVDDGCETKDDKTMVVRVVCHGTERLRCKERSHSKGEIHSGRVWVSVLSVNICTLT